MKLYKDRFWIFWLLNLMPVVTVAIILYSIQLPRDVIPVLNNSTPYGYTYSLLLFITPVIILGAWFLREPNHSQQKKAFWYTNSICTLIGWIVDVFFGNTFFDFKNHTATLGIYLPSYDIKAGWLVNIPIEDFAFYFLGNLFILIFYIFGKFYWLEEYTIHGYPLQDKDNKVKIFSPHFPSLILAIIILILGLAYKKFGLHPYHDGLPGYFIFVLVGTTLCTFPILKGVYPFINWHSLHFTLYSLLPISIIWEVTIAIPYQWWNYKSEQMMGIFIESWNNLPVESVFVWFASVWGAVIIYEFFCLYIYYKSNQ